MLHQGRSSLDSTFINVTLSNATFSAPLTPTPLLTFHDRTPVWTARCSSGLIEMDEGQCRVLGVEPAFYVAVALTYLEFLEDREVRRRLSFHLCPRSVRWPEWGTGASV